MLLLGGRDSLSTENGNTSARKTEFVLQVICSVLYLANGVQAGADRLR